MHLIDDGQAEVRIRLLTGKRVAIITQKNIDTTEQCVLMLYLNSKGK